MIHFRSGLSCLADALTIFYFSNLLDSIVSNLPLALLSYITAAYHSAHCHLFILIQGCCWCILTFSWFGGESCIESGILSSS